MRMSLVTRDTRPRPIDVCISHAHAHSRASAILSDGETVHSTRDHARRRRLRRRRRRRHQISAKLSSARQF